MSIGINKVMLQGRIAKMFDLIYFGDGTPSMPITLATSERYSDKDGARKERTEFHRVVFVGRSADVVQRYAMVGQELYVCGKLTHRSYGEGEQRQYITEVRVDDMDFEFGAKPRLNPEATAQRAHAGGTQARRQPGGSS